MNLLNKGFTIIELMIAIAIIGILAAIAVPAYNNYTVRSRVSESFAMIDSVKIAVSEFYQSSGSYPTSNTEVGLPTVLSGTNTQAVSVTNDGTGRIIAVTSIAVANGTFDITFSPSSDSEDVITWTCSSNGSAYLPSTCR